MYILGMESSCDETSAAVVEMGDGVCRIKSDIVASQIEIHRLYGGVVPEIAGRAHIEAVSRITYEALETAGLTIKDLGAVAVTSHPGLIGALLVGVNFAKSLAFANGLPLVGVNHIKGHVAAAYLAHAELKPPFTALVVSGGHTSIYRVSDYTDFKEIGATRDDAAGEAFDKIGRVIGLPYPAGAAMDKLAYEGKAGSITLPSPALVGDTLDFSFSGIKTAALNYINGLTQRGEEKNMEFSTKYACEEHNMSFGELEPRMFSFNNPYGACPECAGLGDLRIVSETKIRPDKSLSLREGAIVCNGFKTMEEDGWIGPLVVEVGRD